MGDDNRKIYNLKKETERISSLLREVEPNSSLELRLLIELGKISEQISALTLLSKIEKM